MADQILTMNGKTAGAGTGLLNLLSFDFISGLQMLWVSGTALTVTTGAACRPSDGLLLQPAANIAKTGLSLTASTWYHVYLYLNGSTPDIEIVTTAPAAAYFGTARAKTGDTTRRYIGSIVALASGAILKFDHHPEAGTIKYKQDVNTAPLRLFANVSPITETTQSCLSVVPITAKVMHAFADNTSTNAGDIAYISNSEVGSPPNTNILAFVRGARELLGEIVLDSSQAFTYICATASAAFSCWCVGYTFER